MRVAVMACATGAVVGLSACSADAADYRSAAEKVIRDDVERVIDGAATATCNEPASTEADTEFTCVGIAADGSRFRYRARIVKDKQVQVDFVSVVDAPPAAATTTTAPTSTTVVASTALPTTTVVAG